jgi:hypothetical protein
VGSLNDAADRLGSAAAAMVAMEAELEAGQPWPMAEQFGVEPEASWGPPEVLAHVSEMIPYWLGEIERIVAAPANADPLPFGRISSDPIRIAIIGRDRAIPIRELLARISADARRVGARLRELEAAGVADRRGLHPRLDEMALPDIAERFMAGHATEHVTQLREILAARS